MNLILAIDVSKEINSYREKYIKYINEFIEPFEQDTNLIVILFSQRIKYYYIGLKSNFKPLTENDLQLTQECSFFDSLAACLINTDRFFRQTKRMKTMLVVFTDGAEDTTSKRIKPRMLALQLAYAKKSGWLTIYNARNELACNAAVILGFDKVFRYSLE